MYLKKERIKDEQQKIIGIIPVIDMKHFVTLLLADLASKTPIIRFDENKIKTACLSTDHKKIIENIMYQENGWGIKFATLIDIYSYYESQSDWEKQLGKTIEDVLNELNKEFIYDFEYDIIRIDFTEEEIKNIKSQYDKATLEEMDHFSNLMNDKIFTRNWSLEMNEINRNSNRLRYEYYESNVRLFRKNGIKRTKEYEKYIGKFEPHESKF